MDMQVKELIATALTINDDEDLPGDDFLIIAAGTVHDPQPGWEPEELQAKTAAGAQLIITQLCFDVELLKRYMSYLVARKLVHTMSFVISLATLPSADIAQWLRDNRRRALIPPGVIQRLEQSVDSEAEGVAICSELLQQYAEIPGISGVNLITPGDPDTINAAVRDSGLRR